MGLLGPHLRVFVNGLKSWGEEVNYLFAAEVIGGHSAREFGGGSADHSEFQLTHKLYVVY